MEHAERLCDKIILMASGKVVFNGTTEEALAQAPRRVRLASENKGLAEFASAFSDDIERKEDGSLLLTLKADALAHDILEKSVNSKLRLTRYEPSRATLHEAFVALVGQDVVANMALEPDVSGSTI